MMKFVKYLLLGVVFTTFSYLIFIRVFNITFAYIFSVLSAILSSYLLRNKVSEFNFNKLFILSFFLLILFIPLVGEKEDTSLENRTLAPFPEWRWSNVWSFFSGYQDYFNDRFTFRNQLINIYGNLTYEQIQSKPITIKSIIGKEDWLFMSKKDYINQISIPFTSEELQIINYNLNVTTEWFKKHGIKYYLTVPPAKPRVYPEYLPDYMRVRLNFCKMDQVKSYLNLKSSIQFIDFKEELIANKKHQQLYYKTDTHWNEFGAFIGYTKIIQRIAQDFPQIKPLKLEDFTVTKEVNHEGDLLAMLGYNSNFFATRYTLYPKDSIEPTFIYSTKPIIIRNGFEKWKMPNNKTSLSIFVIRDSYTTHMKKFISASFENSVYAWMPEIPIYKIAEEKPDIVLHEIFERFVHFNLELPPEIENDTTFLKNYKLEDY